MAELLQIRVQGQEAIERKVKLMAKALDTTQVLDEGAAILLYNIRKRYLQMVNSEGHPWKPSHAAEIRAALGKGGGTLYDTGRLFHSIQLFAAGGNVRAIGTDVPYGRKHNMGEERMIKREFLAFGSKDVQTVQELVVRRIREALNA